MSMKNPLHLQSTEVKNPRRWYFKPNSQGWDSNFTVSVVCKCTCVDRRNGDVHRS